MVSGKGRVRVRLRARVRGRGRARFRVRARARARVRVEDLTPTRATPLLHCSTEPDRSKGGGLDWLERRRRVPESERTTAGGIPCGVGLRLGLGLGVRG